MEGTVQPIKVGTQWEQRMTRLADGKEFVRVVEVIGQPTLSSPVNLRILRNDMHPHRVGKTTSLGKSVLRRTYRAVG